MRRLAIFTVCLLALAACASADVFDFSYSGTNLWDSSTTCLSALNDCTGASGKLVAHLVGVDTWQVDSGSGVYMEQDHTAHTITIIPGAGTSPMGLFFYDNTVTPYPHPAPLLDNTGLLFKVTTTVVGGQELNIYWNNGAGGVNLYDAIIAPPGYSGDSGGFSVVHENVPDGGMTLMLLGSALTGIAILRRKLRA